MKLRLKYLLTNSIELLLLLYPRTSTLTSRFYKQPQEASSLFCHLVFLSRHSSTSSRFPRWSGSFLDFDCHVFIVHPLATTIIVSVPDFPPHPPNVQLSATDLLCKPAVRSRSTAAYPSILLYTYPGFDRSSRFCSSPPLTDPPWTGI